MNKKLQPYDYINSLNGSEAILENHQEFADYVMRFQDAFQTAMRFSKELIDAQQKGTIQMTDVEYEEVVKNYELMRSMLNDE